MLRANLMPGQKKKKGFNLSSPDRMLILAVVTISIFLGGTYIYTLYEKQIANDNLTTLIQEETGYVAEKTLYDDNQALSQKTFDLEKYLDTALGNQINENAILSNISKYMLPDTYLDKITFDIGTAGLVMNFRSASFESLTVLFSHLLADAKIKDVKIGSYTLALKGASSTTSGTKPTSNDATMQIIATWIMNKKTAVAQGSTSSTTPPAETSATTTNSSTTTPTGGTP